MTRWYRSIARLLAVTFLLHSGAAVAVDFPCPHQELPQVTAEAKTHDDLGNTSAHAARHRHHAAHAPVETSSKDNVECDCDAACDSGCALNFSASITIPLITSENYAADNDFAGLVVHSVLNRVIPPQLRPPITL